MAEQSIGLVSLVVPDYDEALAFYVGVLGFELVEDSFVPEQNKRWVVIAPPGARESRLLLARASTAEQASRIGNQTGGRVFLFLYTDDFERDFRRYRAQGVVFVREPVQQPYGTVAVFRDPWGTLWDLLQPRRAADTEAPVAPLSALRLPFDGTWFVAQAGDTLNVNHHMGVRAQWFGVDFAKTGGASGRALASSTAPTGNDEWYGWDAPVLSPADGTIVAVESAWPDHPPGVHDRAHPAGNHVAIALAPGAYLFLAHLRQHSPSVAVGDPVRRGQPLGRCGNSGNSDAPHLHVHAQDTPVLGDGTGQPMTFAGLDLQLSGKAFANVTWPLIAGLFVSPHAA